VAPFFAYRVSEINYPQTDSIINVLQIAF